MFKLSHIPTTIKTLWLTVNEADEISDSEIKTLLTGSDTTVILKLVTKACKIKSLIFFLWHAGMKL